MRALREIKYQIDRDRSVVTVPMGAELNDSTLQQMRENRIDIEKMVRTRYMEREEAGVVAAPPPRRRGRPRKNP